MPTEMASNNSKLPVVMGAGMVAAMGAGFFVVMSTGGADSASVDSASARAAAPLEATPPQVLEASPRTVTSDPAAAHLAPADSRDAAHSPSVRPNRMARDVKREQIWSALGREHQLEPAAPGSAAPNEQTALRLPELDREYIRSAIGEQLLPVAIECYESALADDPALAGKIVAEFTIVGVEEVGGVVEEAAIKADESTLDSEFVRECMRESLLAVTFEPPPDGGQVKVTYPFEFSP
jgi:hypothetical protein